jgi:hypothetical protein
LAEKIGSCLRGEVEFGGEVVELYGCERPKAAAAGTPI